MDLVPQPNSPHSEGTAPGASSAVSPSPLPSRFESKKQRDWNMFERFLRDHRPPLSLALCSGAHVQEYLRYLDRFGQTKVHSDVCHFFLHPHPLPPCPCPLRQSWESLYGLVRRLRAAYEENGGSPENNPFSARAVRLYLRKVREHRSRVVTYKKNKLSGEKGEKFSELSEDWDGLISCWLGFIAS